MIVFIWILIETNEFLYIPPKQFVLLKSQTKLLINTKDLRYMPNQFRKRVDMEAQTHFKDTS